MASVTGTVFGTVVILLISCHSASSISVSCNSHGIRWLRELTSGSSWCEYLSPNTTVNWVLNHVSGRAIPLGTCSSICSITYHLVSSLTRYSSSISMSFNATREMAGVLVCTEIFRNGTTTSDNCTQDVVYPFDVEAPSVTTNLQDWSLTAVFSVRKVFSALGLYDMDIVEHKTALYYYYYYNYAGLSFAKTETDYEEYSAANGLQYYRGKFIATWSFPKKSGKYLYTGSLIPVSYTDVRLYPQDKGYMEIMEPEPPTTDCAYTYIPEVGPINCQCSTKSLGTPAGRLRWLVGNEVIATGGYDVKQLQFPTSRVNRSHDGMLVLCQVDWVEKEHVFVTDSVAYGPGNVNIEVQYDDCLFVATCNVRDVKPFTPDMIRWGGLCEGQEGAVCTFTSSDAQADGKEVTCTVTNRANNGHSVSTSLNIPLQVTVCDSEDSTMGKTLGIGVGVTVGVTLVVLAVVVGSYIIWTRRLHYDSARKTLRQARRV